MCSEALANTICTGEADARLRTSWQFTKPCLHTECFNQSMFNVQQHSNKGTQIGCIDQHFVPRNAGPPACFCFEICACVLLNKSAAKTEECWTTDSVPEFARAYLAVPHLCTQACGNQQRAITYK